MMATSIRTALSNDDSYTHIACDIRHYLGPRRTKPHARCGASLIDASEGNPPSSAPTCPGCATIQCGMDAR